MTKLMYYKRDGTPISDTREWVREFGIKNRIVKQETLPDGKLVSTVFLGLDHNYSKEGPPLIFETMVFPSETERNDLDMDRYSTEEQAVEGHKKMVKKWSNKKRR